MSATIGAIPRIVAAPLWSSQTDYGPAFVAASARDIDPNIWANAWAQHAKDSRFNEVVEQGLDDQFEQRYFVLVNSRRDEICIQTFFVVKQDLTAGLPRTIRQTVTQLRQRWRSLLFMRMLMVGSPAAEGLLDREETWAVEALRAALEKYARRERIGMVLLKDFPGEYRYLLEGFTSRNYQRIPGLPAVRLDLDFSSFEEFVAKKLSKSYRKNLRRKFKVLESFPRVDFEVHSGCTAEQADEIFPLYWEVYQRAKLSFEVLNRDYLARLGQVMPDKIRLFLWRQEGRLVAFNMVIVHEGIVDDLYVGFDYEVARTLNLYFLTWRDVIDWSVRNGLKTYRSGPLNYDPKLHLKMSLVPQDLYARHLSPIFNRPLLLAMKWLGPTRYEPILKQFPNANEL
jgi:Acetyltransferase (GNAT) domain